MLQTRRKDFDGAQSQLKSNPRRRLHQAASNVEDIFVRETIIKASWSIYLIGLKSTYAADLGTAKWQNARETKRK